MKLYQNTEWEKIKLNGEDLNIPVGWNYSNLKKLSYVTDGTHSSPKTVLNTDYHYLTVRDLDWNGNIDFVNAERVTEEDYTKLVKGNCSPVKNDILLSKDGTVGKTAIFNSEFKAVVLSSLAIIRFQQLNPGYGYFIFKHSYTKNNLFDHKNGNAIKRIVLKQLNAFEVFYPSEIEQLAIYQLLSKQESIIRKTKNLIENIEKRNQFMRAELLSGSIRITEEKGLQVFKKNHSDNWREVMLNGEKIKVPKDWDNFKLEKYIQCNMGETILSANIKDLEFSGSIPVVSASQEDKYFGYINKNIVKKMLKKGELTVCARGSIGFPRITKEEVASTQTTIQIRSDVLDLNYLCKYLNTNHSKFFNSTGGAVPQLTLGMVNEFEIVQPKNKLELESILLTIQSLEKEKQKYEQILEKEEKTFTFLLEELMSGRLRIKI